MAIRLLTGPEYQKARSQGLKVTPSTQIDDSTMELVEPDDSVPAKPQDLNQPTGTQQQTSNQPSTALGAAGRTALTTAVPAVGGRLAGAGAGALAGSALGPVGSIVGGLGGAVVGGAGVNAAQEWLLDKFAPDFQKQRQADLEAHPNIVRGARLATGIIGGGGGAPQVGLWRSAPTTALKQATGLAGVNAGIDVASRLAAGQDINVSEVLQDAALAGALSRGIGPVRAAERGVLGKLGVSEGAMEHFTPRIPTTASRLTPDQLANMARQAGAPEAAVKEAQTPYLQRKGFNSEALLSMDLESLKGIDPVHDVVYALRKEGIPLNVEDVNFIAQSTPGMGKDTMISYYRANRRPQMQGLTPPDEAVKAAQATPKSEAPKSAAESAAVIEDALAPELSKEQLAGANAALNEYKRIDKAFKDVARIAKRAKGTPAELDWLEQLVNLDDARQAQYERLPENLKRQLQTGTVDVPAGTTLESLIPKDKAQEVPAAESGTPPAKVSPPEPRNVVPFPAPAERTVAPVMPAVAPKVEAPAPVVPPKVEAPKVETPVVPPKVEPPAPPKQETLVPETQATIAEQMKLFRKGVKKAVLITEGEAIPQLYPGETITKVPGRGKVIHRAGRSSKQILEMEKSGELGRLLGYGIGEKPVNPTGVVEVVKETPKGPTEVQAVLTDEANKPAVVEAAKTAAEASGGKVVETTPEKVIAERVGYDKGIAAMKTLERLAAKRQAGIPLTAEEQAALSDSMRTLESRKLELAEEIKQQKNPTPKTEEKPLGDFEGTLNSAWERWKTKHNIRSHTQEQMNEFLAGWNKAHPENKVPEQLPSKPVVKETTPIPAQPVKGATTATPEPAIKPAKKSKMVRTQKAPEPEAPPAPVGTKVEMGGQPYTMKEDGWYSDKYGKVESAQIIKNLNQQARPKNVGAAIQAALDKNKQGGFINLGMIKDAAGKVNRAINPIEGLRKLTEPVKARIERAFGDIGKKFTGALRDAYTTRDQIQGPLHAYTRELARELSSDDKVTIAKYLQDINTAGKSAITLSPKQQFAADGLRRIIDVIGLDKSRPDSPWVTFWDPTGASRNRPFKPRPGYYPEVIRAEVLDVLQHPENYSQNEWNQLADEFIKHHMAKTGGTREDAATAWLNRQNPAVGKSAPNPEFRGLRYEEGIGLPDSWVEKDPFKAADLYITRHATDMAWHRHVESNPELGHALGLEEDGKGNKYPILNSKGEIPKLARADIVKSALRDYVGAVAQGARNQEKLTHLFTSPIVGPLSQMKDILTPLGQLSEIATPAEMRLIIKPLFTAFSKSARESAIIGGSAKGTRNLVFSAGEDMTSTASTVADMISRATGAEQLSQAGRVMLDGFGRALANKRLSEGNFELFEKFGPADWRDRIAKKDFAGLVDHTAAQITKNFAGSYDFADLPPELLKGSEAGFFKALFALQRWSVGRFNRWYDNVYTPAKNGNIGPLIGTLLGGAVSAGAINWLTQQVTQRKPRELTWEEYLKLGDKVTAKEKAYTLFSKAATAGYAGIASDLAMGIVQMASGESPRGFNNMAYRAGADAVTRAGQFLAALGRGDAGIEDLPTLAQEMIKDRMQVARIIMGTPDDTGMREERIARRTGYMPEKSVVSTLPNPFSESGRYRREDIQGLARRYKQDMMSPQGLQMPSSALRQTVSVKDGRPVTYYDFINEAQGPEAARSAVKRDADNTIKRYRTMSTALRQMR